MKKAHNISVSVFSTPEDDDAAVRKALLSLFPFDLEKEKIPMKSSSATGFNERRILIHEVFLDRDRLVNAFIDGLVSRLSDDQLSLILKQADSRIGEDMNFYLRLDKAKLMEGVCWITDGGNCIHIRIALAAFPKKRASALALVNGIFRKI